MPPTLNHPPRSAIIKRVSFLLCFEHKGIQDVRRCRRYVLANELAKLRRVLERCDHGQVFAVALSVSRASSRSCE